MQKYEFYKLFKNAFSLGCIYILYFKQQSQSKQFCFSVGSCTFLSLVLCRLHTVNMDKGRLGRLHATHFFENAALCGR